VNTLAQRENGVFVDYNMPLLDLYPKTPMPAGERAGAAGARPSKKMRQQRAQEAAERGARISEVVSQLSAEDIGAKSKLA